MEKVVIHKPGSYDTLKLERSEIPEPKEGEVLVQVEAIGVNYADICVRMGVYESAKKYVGWPITPGFEFSGTILLNRHSNSKLKEGTCVFGVTRFGAYASHLCVPADQVFEVPEGMSMEEAAGFPVVMITAYYAMMELAHPRPGQHILVHSAAGGVGSCLVQLGKINNCYVTAVVGSSHKIDYCRSLGADHVIDKSKETLWVASDKYTPGYDIVFDANGVSTLSESYKHLKPGGKLVVYGFHSMLPKQGGYLSIWRLPKLVWDWWRTPNFSPFKMITDNKSVMCFNLSYMFHELEFMRESIEQIVEWFKKGKVSIPKVTIYDFKDVVKAHQAIESGLTIGKLILTVKPKSI